jgi:uncharacterized membrane protein YeaQ/YmgE (transglycosylase-associated protein family)
MAPSAPGFWRSAPRGGLSRTFAERFEEGDVSLHQALQANRQGNRGWRVDTMGIIAWLILGLISGFIASKLINKTGEGLVMDIVLGIVGAFVGGWLFSHFLPNMFGGTPVSGLNIPSLFVAVIGAVIVLLIYHMVFRRRV